MTNALPIEDALYSRKKKVYETILTPALLTAITEHLYVKITMFLIAIEDQMFVK